LTNYHNLENYETSAILPDNIDTSKDKSDKLHNRLTKVNDNIVEICSDVSNSDSQPNLNDSLNSKSSKLKVKSPSVGSSNNDSYLCVSIYSYNLKGKVEISDLKQIIYIKQYKRYKCFE
jgi:hypothetical protein